MIDGRTVHVQLVVAGECIEGAVNLPAGPTPRHVILPTLQGITDAIVDVAERQLSGSGERVTCKKGCDACCRQMVPLGAAEAFYLEQTIEAMDGRAAVGVKRRFERVMGELERVGLLERLRKREGLNPEQLSQLDRDYFAAQIACPFLVDRSCSIHARRPLACREFLVTSPARHCRDPDSGKVREIRMPAKVSKALWETGGSGGWLPLALAREFAATHQEDSIDDAAAAVQDVLENL